jgi:hypothetical protein
MNGYGYDVHTEDSMVSIEYTGELHETDEELQVFILPDLFPAVRKAMDVIEARQRERGDAETRLRAELAAFQAEHEHEGEQHGGRADGGRSAAGEAAQDPGRG